jgi:hypothetical protein
MKDRRALGFVLSFVAVAVVMQPLIAQSDRGTAELSVGSGKVTVDYGRPLLKGRDPLTWQKDGTYWRMGSNDMTTLTTSTDLSFGKVRIPKGTHGLWLHKVSTDTYELVFNSVTTGMGMSHDSSRDLAAVPLKKETALTAVETFTIELRASGSGGNFVMSWGTFKLTAEFTAAK